MTRFSEGAYHRYPGFKLALHSIGESGQHVAENRAVSSSKCNGYMKAQLRIGFQERGKIKTCSRAHVQSVGDGVQLALGITGQAHPLGQVLAQQAIGAFARATLPRHMRIGKGYLDREVVRQPLVPQRSA